MFLVCAVIGVVKVFQLSYRISVPLLLPQLGNQFTCLMHRKYDLFVSKYYNLAIFHCFSSTTECSVHMLNDT